MPGITLATAYYELLPSMRGNEAAISQQMGAAGAASSKSFTSKFQGGMAANFKALGAVAAGAAAVGFVKESVAEGRIAQKVGAATAKLIQNQGKAATVTAAGVGELADKLSHKTAIDEKSIQSGQNLLLSFKAVQNQTGKGNAIFDRASASIVDLGVKMKTGPEGAAKLLGKALADPVKGMALLRRGGVALTTQQQEQIKTFAKSGDTLSAQKVILGAVEGSVGGLAAASATGGDKMHVAWDKFQTTVGTALIPALDQLEGALVKVFTFITAHQSVMIAIGAVIGVILVAALVAATVAVWSFTVALLANPLVWIVIAIIALIVGIVLLIKHWDLVKAKTIAVWNTIKTFLVGLWDGLKAKMVAAWDAIKNAVTTKAQQLLDFVKTLPQKILDLYLFLPRKMLAIGADIVHGLKDGISGAWHFVTDKVNELIAKIPLAVRKLMGIASPSKVMMELGSYMSEGLALGIDSGRPRIQDSLHGITSSASSSTPSSPAPTSFYLKSGALRIIDGQAWVEGIIENQAFAAGMVSA